MIFIQLKLKTKRAKKEKNSINSYPPTPISSYTSKRNIWFRNVLAINYLINAFRILLVTVKDIERYQRMLCMLLQHLILNAEVNLYVDMYINC